jgi:hypothetical protein
MRCLHMTKYTPMLLCLLSGLMTEIPLAAQAVGASQPGRGIMFARYNPANEVTLNGAIQGIVTKRTVGTPPGMHLLVAGPRGMVDAHIGPFLAKDVQAALRAGTPVQIVGAMEQLHGQQFLLTRQIVFNGRVVNVRSSNGFLLRAVPTRTSRIAARASAQNGGR